MKFLNVVCTRVLACVCVRVCSTEVPLHFVLRTAKSTQAAQKRAPHPGTCGVSEAVAAVIRYLHTGGGHCDGGG